MADNREIEEKFWKSLKSDMTFMLELVGVEEGHAQPMTAQFDGEPGQGPVYVFTSKETDLARELDGPQPAAAHFVAKDHELFATVRGRLFADNDRAVIDRLWNPFVAAWYQDGKDDPKLLLLRFEPEEAKIWLNETSLLAGVKLLFGRDPKKEYQDKVAEVRLQ